MMHSGGANVSLPFVTMSHDQTKIQVILHVSSPTNPYRNPCSRCGSHWWFWFGLASFTTTYHRIDLALGRPSASFTNHYHRTGGQGGQGIDVSVVASVAGWATVARVITVDNGGTPSRVAHTIAVGRRKKKFFRMVTVA